jgi:hypothetical protein
MYFLFTTVLCATVATICVLTVYIFIYLPRKTLVFYTIYIINIHINIYLSQKTHHMSVSNNVMILTM